MNRRTRVPRSRRLAAVLTTLAYLAAVAPVARGQAPAEPESPPPTTAPAAPEPPAAPPATLPSAAALGISPTRAVLVTPLFPGWGQLYSGSGWRAALAFGAETVYWTQLIKNDRKAVRWRTMAQTIDPVDHQPLRDIYTAQEAEYRALVRDFAWWSLGALLIIALDAYVDANLYGFDQDPVPVPDHWDELTGGAAAAPIPAADFAVTLFRAGF